MNDQRRNHHLCNEKPWKDNPQTIWIGSTITLHRNLEKFKFPGKLASDKKKQIISLVGKELMSSPGLKNPKLFKAEELSPIEKEYLIEHFLSPQGFQQAQTGEAFILDESGEFLGLLNLGDHLVLQKIDSHDNLEETWSYLVKMEDQLNQTVNFSFSSKFGFLTSDPTQCGTALIVRVFLHLPGLIYSNRFDETIKKYKDDGVFQTGLQGDPNEIIGDIVAFHNAFTLGVTEENILSTLRTLTTKFLVEEKSARAQMKTENTSAMKDRISRAFAILLHSYQIEAVEAMNAVSLLKLGIDLDWVTGTSHAQLNELFFNCRRAHLLCHFPSKVAQEDVVHKRAEFIHKSLQGISLNF